MTIEEAKVETARWECVDIELLKLTNEDAETFCFMYKKSTNFYKVAIDKKSQDFYGMTDTLTRREIREYEKAYQ